MLLGIHIHARARASTHTHTHTHTRYTHTHTVHTHTQWDTHTHSAGHTHTPTHTAHTGPVGGAHTHTHTHTEDNHYRRMQHVKRVSPAGVPPGQFLLVEVHSGYPVAVLTHPGVVTVHVVGRPVNEIGIESPSCGSPRPPPASSPCRSCGG